MKVRYLGGHLDSNLTIKELILVKCKATTLNIIMICNIRKYLTKNMPQTYSTTGHIIYRLCKLNGSRTTIIKYKNHAKNPKHSCKTNPGKTCQRKHHRVPQNLTLVTNTAKE